MKYVTMYYPEQDCIMYIRVSNPKKENQTEIEIHEVLSDCIVYLRPTFRNLKVAARKAINGSNVVIPKQLTEKFNEIKIDVKEKYAKKLREKYMPKH